MEKIKDEKLRKILQEMAELLHGVYGNLLKAVILYGSVARGTQTEDSDVDIMVLVDGTDAQLREYDEKLSDVSTDLALKYMKVFSIIDIKYQEYQENNANWLPAILEAKEKELAEMQQRLQQFSQNASMEYSNMQQQLLEPVMQKAREAVEKIGKANGFTYVFDLSAGSIIYFDAVNSTDILPMAKSELGIPADKTVPTNMAAQAN